MSIEKIIAPTRMFLQILPLYIPKNGVLTMTPIVPANSATMMANTVRNAPNTRLLRFVFSVFFILFSTVPPFLIRQEYTAI